MRPRLQQTPRPRSGLLTSAVQRRMSSRDRRRTQKPVGKGIGGYFERQGEAEAPRPKSKMATVSSQSEAERQSPAPDPMEGQTPQEGADQNPRPGTSVVLELGLGEEAPADLPTYIRSLPTRSEIEKYIARIEEAHKKELEVLKQDLIHVGQRMVDVEESVEAVSSIVVENREAIRDNTVQIQDLQTQIDDLQNRHRRNNIRIRGVPETVTPAELMPTVKAIFNQLLDRPKDAEMEIDRAHRSLGPKSNDPKRPRDIICRVHYYRIKDQIIQAARSQDSIIFNESPIMILQDLSQHTLSLRKALKPLTEILRSNSIKYKWGFPFQISATRDGKTAWLRNINDLPRFLETLELSDVELPDWPIRAALPPLPQRNMWQEVRKHKSPGKQKSSRKER